MARRLDPVISTELEQFAPIIVQYKQTRDPDKRRELALKAGKVLLERNAYWPTPEKWCVGKYGTGEEGKARVAFRSLVQCFDRRNRGKAAKPVVTN